MSVLYNNYLFYPEKPILQESKYYLKLKKTKYKNYSYGGFHSIAEYRRWRFLSQLEAAGDISNLQLQPKFNFVDDKERTYKGDFMYELGLDLIVEDVKSYDLMDLERFNKIAKLLKIKYQAKFLIVPIKWILSHPMTVQIKFQHLLKY
jgi:hypothetical protein